MLKTLDSLINILCEYFQKPIKAVDISDRLGINQETLHGHVSKLRELGYQVENDANCEVYFLRKLPEKLDPNNIQSYLKTNFIGQDVHYYSELNSYTDTAFDLANQYPIAEESMTPLRRIPRHLSQEHTSFAGNGSVIVSELAPGDCSIWRTSQSGINLYSSVVLRPGILPTRAPQIALVACVALARVLDATSGVRPTLKWPNVLMAKGKPLAKIKIKMKSNIDKINFLILGFEVNLNGMPEDLELPLRESVTSLRHVSGKVVNRAYFAASLFKELEKWYVTYINKGPEKIIREVNHYLPHKAKSVEVNAGDKTLTGSIEGLDTDGILILRTAQGDLTRIPAGNIALDELQF